MIVELVPQKVEVSVKTKALLGASRAAATAAVLASTIMKLAVSGALNQVWALINGMQIMVHMPLFKVKIPDNAMVLVKQIINIATFDIPKVNVVDIFGADKLPKSNEIMHDVSDATKGLRNNL